MVAIDVMGGDLAPDAVLSGALRAAKQGIPVMLFGPEILIKEKLLQLDPHWSGYDIAISDAPEIIEMDDDPVRSVRKKRRSSLVEAVASVKKGICSAVISAGNSGAMVAAGMLVLGRKKGIKRPVMAGFLPSIQDSVLCLDLGANTECKPRYLLQFAQMGNAYLKTLKNIEKPRIGLLSNGTEDRKGSLLVKDTHALLAKSDLNFIGNIEPQELFAGNVDIVVTDGFSGNILLKTAESTVSFVKQLIKAELGTLAHGNEEQKAMMQTVGGLLEKVSQKAEGVKQGGALLLGVKGIMIIAHGRANDEAIEHSIKAAWDAAQMPQMVEASAPVAFNTSQQN